MQPILDNTAPEYLVTSELIMIVDADLHISSLKSQPINAGMKLLPIHK